MSGELDRQIQARQDLRERQYRQAERDWIAGQQDSLRVRIDSLDEAIAKVMARINRIEEVLDLREIYELPSKD